MPVTVPLKEVYKKCFGTKLYSELQSERDDINSRSFTVSLWSRNMCDRTVHMEKVRQSEFSLAYNTYRIQFAFCHIAYHDIFEQFGKIDKANSLLGPLDFLDCCMTICYKNGENVAKAVEAMAARTTGSEFNQFVHFQSRQEYLQHCVDRLEVGEAPKKTIVISGVFIPLKEANPCEHMFRLVHVPFVSFVNATGTKVTLLLLFILQKVDRAFWKNCEHFLNSRQDYCR